MGISAGISVADAAGFGAKGSSASASALNPNAGLSAEFAAIPLLDGKQVGHLRHIRNLAELPDGDWSFMGILDPGQEDTIATRYQLAKMAYALGLTHYNRLPAAPGAFANDFRNLIRKMRRYDVWSYWEKTSRSSTILDPELEALRDGWMDPVVKENIMYSGHLQAMAGMYAVLFDDDRFEQPGGLTLSYRPLFQADPQSFVYDYNSLSEVIYWQMMESGFLGVPCEPNLVFMVCNQFPILGFRFQDIRNGTNRAEHISRSHLEAWKRNQLFGKNGHFTTIWRVRQNNPIGEYTPWTAAVMNAWNRDFIRELYPKQVESAFIDAPDGMLLPRPATGEDRYSRIDPSFGMTAIWLSEMGDTERLEALLAYADSYLDPTWYKGGLFYPRNDTIYNEDGNFTGVDPWTGNSLLAYARLNVEDGLHKLYSKPWGEEHFLRPNLGSVSSNVNVLRADYARDGRAMVLTLCVDEAARRRTVDLTLRNLASCENWVLTRDAGTIARGQAASLQDGADGISLDEQGLHLHMIADQPTNLVLAW